MQVAQNIITPRNGEPLISATQDFLTASYLLSRRDVMLDRAEFCQLVSFMFDGAERVELPPPTIVKPVKLWTGKQLFQVLLSPNAKNSLNINLEVKEKNIYERDTFMDPKDGCTSLSYLRVASRSDCFPRRCVFPQLGVDHRHVGQDSAGRRLEGLAVLPPHQGAWPDGCGRVHVASRQALWPLYGYGME